MRRAGRNLAVLVIAALLVAVTGAAEFHTPTDPPSQPEERLSEETEAALPFIVIGSTDGEYVDCAGVFVRPFWILTAAHCISVSGQRLGAVVHIRPREAPLFFVEQAVLHPKRDVALLRIMPYNHQIRYMHVAGNVSRYLGDVGVIRILERPNTKLGPLRGFAREKIASVAMATFVGQVTTGSGPCVGDSGGALLMQDHDDEGSMVVAGVLSQGSMSCKQADIFERADAVADWIAQTVSYPPVEDGSWCGHNVGMEPPSRSLSCTVGGGLDACRFGTRKSPYCKPGHLSSELREAWAGAVGNVVTRCALAIVDGDV